jgi:D-alanyl-D-alanine carboxypeptidase
MPVRHPRATTAALAVALVVGAAGAAAAAGTSPTAPNPSTTTTTTVAQPPSVDAIARMLLARGDTAVSVSAWRNGQPLLVQAWGKGPNANVTAQSRFELASISKLITSLSLHRLAAQGRVSLDANVAPMLKSFGIKANASWANVTIRQLLTHTSGAPSGDSLIFGRTAVRDCVGVARSLATAPLWRPPGTRFNYSNGGYCILGLVLQYLTGTTVERASTKLVWSPLHISGPHIARTGSRSAGDVVHPVTPGRRYLEPLGAAGAWMASPSELVAVVANMTPAERDAMTVPTKASFGTYGEGARVMADGSWGHTGTLEAARACVFVEADGTIWAAMVAGKSPINGAALYAKLRPSILALGH